MPTDMDVVEDFTPHVIDAQIDDGSDSDSESLDDDLGYVQLAQDADEPMSEDLCEQAEFAENGNSEAFEANFEADWSQVTLEKSVKKPAPLSKDEENAIQKAMQGFHLPMDNIPEWAKVCVSVCACVCVCV
eukprot:Colp12_sorted_trinity150504_noHs@10779